jgi:hypothetical protein
MTPSGIEPATFREPMVTFKNSFLVHLLHIGSAQLCNFEHIAIPTVQGTGS